MVRVLFVTIAFFSTSAMAATGPCSAGIQDPPIFAVVLGSPVLLSFQQTTNSMFTPPSVTVVGHEIAAWQLPSRADQFAGNCNSQSVSVGDLAPGSYTITWNYQALESPGPVPPAATFPFAFTVPETAPCGGMEFQPPAPIAGQPFAIAYSIAGRGFIQPPSVTISGGLITIDQPSAIADPLPGHPDVSCGRGFVGITSLQPGFYAVVVRSFASVELVGLLTIRPATRSRAVRGH
ncbi:MAG TPA: hypothetical protein VGQ21_06955 [Thermoanaerobaculia bacterium]|nr:hypothetical protein [Thermoanaerobaculia bacterium]